MQAITSVSPPYMTSDSCTRVGELHTNLFDVPGVESP